MLFRNEEASLQLDIVNYEFPDTAPGSEDSQWLVLRATWRTEDGNVVKDSNSCLQTFELQSMTAGLKVVKAGIRDLYVSDFQEGYYFSLGVRALEGGTFEAAVSFIEHDACFYSANQEDSVVYFAHCISRTGSYLSKEAGVVEGTAMAYLIAPPLEAMVALDAALKAADVTLRLFYGPPTETNFAGGLLTGDQAACRAACEAFADTVRGIAQAPTAY